MVDGLCLTAQLDFQGKHLFWDAARWHIGDCGQFSASLRCAFRAILHD
jgi:hypothetical protein